MSQHKIRLLESLCIVAHFFSTIILISLVRYSIIHKTNVARCYNSMETSNPNPSFSAITFLASFLPSNFTGETIFLAFTFFTWEIFNFWTVFLHSRVRAFLFFILVHVLRRGGAVGRLIVSGTWLNLRIRWKLPIQTPPAGW